MSNARSDLEVVRRALAAAAVAADGERSPGCGVEEGASKRGDGDSAAHRRGRASLRSDRWKRVLVARVEAPRMAKAAGAVASAAVGVGHDVVNDVVRAIGISRNPGHPEQVVQAQVVPCAPGDIVVGARGVAAYAKASNDHLPYGVEGEAAPKHIDAPDSLADHRIVGRPIVARI